MSEKNKIKNRVAQDDEIAAIFALGANFFSQGQYKKAQIIFAGLIALDMTNEKASIAYGESLLMAGQVQKALYHFIRAKKRFASTAIEAGLTKASILLKRAGLNFS